MTTGFKHPERSSLIRTSGANSGLFRNPEMNFVERLVATVAP